MTTGVEVGQGAQIPKSKLNAVFPEQISHCKVLVFQKLGK
jgi:hypothetical protein